MKIIVSAALLAVAAFATTGCGLRSAEFYRDDVQKLLENVALFPRGPQFLIHSPDRLARNNAVVPRYPHLGGRDKSAMCPVKSIRYPEHTGETSNGLPVVGAETIEYRVVRLRKPLPMRTRHRRNDLLLAPSESDQIGPADHRLGGSVMPANAINITYIV